MMADRNLAETVAEATAIFRDAREKYHAQKGIMMEAKQELSRLVNLQAAVQKLSAGEVDALGLSIVDGQVVQELPE